MTDGGTSRKTEAAPTAPKASRTKQAAKTKTPKQPKAAKREKIPAGDVCVFAFRTSKDLRDALHRASGPAGASRFAINAITAAIRGDRALFDELTAQARSNTK